MTDVRLELRAVLLVTALAVLSCGSGSSGFRPRVAELNAIELSVETSMCASAPGGIEVCARNATAGEGAACELFDSGCRFTILLQMHGVAPGTSAIGAVEPQDLSLPWRTSTNVVGPAGADGELRGELSFVTRIQPGTIGLRALLLYPPGESPPSLGVDGIDVELLADLDAPLADVLADWPIQTPLERRQSDDRASCVRA